MSEKRSDEEDYRPRDPDEPFLGSAVKDGVLRFTSVTQISMADPKSEGCQRKWAYRYVFRKKLAKAQHFTKGADGAEKLEVYLKTGADVLIPVLRPTKPLFPVPGPDLESEEAFAPGPRGLGKEIEIALKARERLVQLRRSGHRDQPAFQMQIAHERELIRRHAGFVVNDIPIDGAADCRHRRGVFIDEDGKLRGEVPGMSVVETIDLKMLSRIHPQRIQSGERAGTVLPTYAKTAAQLCEDVQMVSYGEWGTRKYPDSTHQRLSHVIANKSKREAVKRTGLLSNDQVHERFVRIEGIIGQLEQLAGAQRIEDIEPTTSSCDSYTHVDPNDITGKKVIPGCGYRYICPLSDSVVFQNLYVSAKETNMMGTSAFDQLNAPSPPPNGAPTQPAQFDPATYAAQVEAEKQRLAAMQGQLLGGMPKVFCTNCGQQMTPDNSSTLVSGQVKHIGCPAAVVVQPTPPPPIVAPPPPPPPPPSTQPAVIPPPPPPPAVVGAVGVKPPDAPTHDWIDQAKPMPMEQILAVEDPELKAKLLEHHKLWTERDEKRKAEEAAANPTPVAEAVWCPRALQKIVITTQMALDKKFVCDCGKSYSMGTMKPIQENGQLVSVIPKHKPVKKETPALPPPPAQQSLPPAPPPPTTTVPPPPPVVAAPLAPPPPPSNLPTQDELAALTAAIVSNAPPVVPSPPPPPPVGQHTAMVEQMFGKELVDAVNQGQLPLLETCPLPPPPPPPSTVMSVEQAKQLLVTNITANIARALIEALKPFAEGK